MPTAHDSVARKLAQKEGTQYNQGQGPDIDTPKKAIEVESESTIDSAKRQLQGFQKPVYVAGASEKATNVKRQRNLTR